MLTEFFQALEQRFRITQRAMMKMKAEIDIVEPMGSDTLVWVNFAGQSVRVRTEGQSGLKSGDTIDVGFGAEKLHLFHKKSETRL